jgi:hypothetical protein
VGDGGEDLVAVQPPAADECIGYSPNRGPMPSHQHSGFPPRRVQPLVLGASIGLESHLPAGALEIGAVGAPEHQEPSQTGQAALSAFRCRTRQQAHRVEPRVVSIPRVARKKGLEERGGARVGDHAPDRAVKASRSGNPIGVDPHFADSGAWNAFLLILRQMHDGMGSLVVGDVPDRQGGPPFLANRGDPAP